MALILQMFLNKVGNSCANPILITKVWVQCSFVSSSMNQNHCQTQYLIWFTYHKYTYVWINFCNQSSSWESQDYLLYVLFFTNLIADFFFLHEQNAAKSIDYIIDTIPSAHSLDPYLALLKTNGKMVLLGVSTKPVQISVHSLIFGKVKFLSFEIKCRIRRPLLNDVKASSSNWL
jgi:hypothetical protein